MSKFPFRSHANAPSKPNQAITAVEANLIATEQPMSKPLALTEEQLKAIEHRVVQLWKIHRGDMEALIAMARERNAIVGGAQNTAPTFTLTL